MQKQEADQPLCLILHPKAIQRGLQPSVPESERAEHLTALLSGFEGLDFRKVRQKSALLRMRKFAFEQEEKVKLVRIAIGARKSRGVRMPNLLAEEVQPQQDSLHDFPKFEPDLESYQQFQSCHQFLQLQNEELI